MFCIQCGRSLPDYAKFCSGCGKVQEPISAEAVQPAASQPQAQPVAAAPSPVIQPASNLVGWSERITDPAFAKYLKNSSRWAYIFSFILFAAAVIGFPIYGEKSGELAMPQSLYYGLGIGGMFVAIAFLTNLARSRDKSWDGVVIDKKVSKRVRYDDDSSTSTTFWVYEIKIKCDNGKTKTIRQENNDTFYNYFQINERVRHHKGFNVLEKYDKSHDSHLFCIACAQRVESSVDHCPRCKCPILK
ncbi:MAG TPA: zinc-ribbon domain-containing protein [bacterium]|nr:zinc-ribbon domain-containing protein [bacterium]